MNKFNLIMCSLLFLSGIAQGQVLGDAVLKCSQQEDSLKRLVCYDGLAAQAKATPQKNQANTARAATPVGKTSLAPKSAAPVLSSAAHVSASPELDDAKEVENFGMENKVQRESQKNKIYAKVAAVTKDARKKLIVRLDNGQQWKQSDAGTYRVKVGESVFLERGALGSFFLGKDDINRRMRAKRIK